jgi:hypothetical protein
VLRLEKFDKGNRELHDLINLWWLDKSEKELSSAVKSEYGFMVFDDERPIVCAFLYPTLGSRMALIGFPIANPLVFFEKRREAIKHLVAGMEAFAKELKYDFLISYAGSKGAKDMWDRQGYLIADKDVTQFYKRLA